MELIKPPSQATGHLPFAAFFAISLSYFAEPIHTEHNKKPASFRGP